MKTYHITNTLSGHDMGPYVADSAEAALDALARDAGYADYSELQSAVPTEPGEIIVTESDEVQRASSRTAWSLSIGGFRVRCIRGDAPLGTRDAWEVQFQHENQWKTGVYSSDPHVALDAVVNRSHAARTAFSLAVQNASRESEDLEDPTPAL
jgi:hypothetical protein